jgi:hypothetical protein
MKIAIVTRAIGESLGISEDDDLVLKLLGIFLTEGLTKTYYKVGSILKEHGYENMDRYHLLSNVMDAFIEIGIFKKPKDYVTKLEKKKLLTKIDKQIKIIESKYKKPIGSKPC